MRVAISSGAPIKIASASVNRSRVAKRACGSQTMTLHPRVLRDRHDGHGVVPSAEDEEARRRAHRFDERVEPACLAREDFGDARRENGAARALEDGRVTIVEPGHHRFVVAQSEACPDPRVTAEDRCDRAARLRAMAALEERDGIRVALRGALEEHVDHALAPHAEAPREVPALARVVRDDCRPALGAPPAFANELPLETSAAHRAGESIDRA